MENGKWKMSGWRALRYCALAGVVLVMAGLLVGVSRYSPVRKTKRVAGVTCVFTKFELPPVVDEEDGEVVREAAVFWRMESFVTPQLFQSLMGHEMPAGEDGMEQLWETEMQEFCWRLAKRVEMPDLWHAVIYVDADLARPMWEGLAQSGKPVRMRMWLKDADVEQPLMEKVKAADVGEVYLHVRDPMNPEKMAFLKGMSALCELDVGKSWEIGDAELECLAELTRLRRLNLRYARDFTDAGLKHLGKLVEMRDLDIRGDADASCQEPMEVTWRGMKSLRGMTELERLAFGEVWDSGEKEDSLAATLACFTKMRRLRLPRNYTYFFEDVDEEIEIMIDWPIKEKVAGPVKPKPPQKSRYDDMLPWLTKMPLLEEINLDFGSYQSPDLSVLAYLPGLRRLDLSGIRYLKDKDLAVLEGLTEMRWLRLPGDGVKYVKNMKHLQTLITYCDVTDEEAALLAELPAIEYLSIADISEAGMAHVARMQNLRTLMVGDISEAGMAHVARMRNLRVLKIWSIPPEAQRGLHHLTALVHLESLDLSHSEHDRTPRQFQAGLSVLAELPNLRELRLCRRDLNGEFGMREVKKLKQITSLDLSETPKLRLEEIKHLSEMTCTFQITPPAGAVFPAGELFFAR